MNEMIQPPPILAVMARDMWDYEDCAIYLKVERSTVKDKYSRLDSWPPKRGGGELGKPLYIADEVKTWARRRSA